MTNGGKPSEGLEQFDNIKVVYRVAQIELAKALDAENQPVTLAILTQNGAADAPTREQFTRAINTETAALGPLDAEIYASDTAAERPWAASHPESGLRGAERLLFHIPGALAQGVDPSDLLIERPNEHSTQANSGTKTAPQSAPPVWGNRNGNAQQHSVSPAPYTTGNTPRAAMPYQAPQIAATQAPNSRKKAVVLSTVGALLLAAIVIAGIVIANGDSGSDNKANSPNSSPSSSPTFSPQVSETEQDFRNTTPTINESANPVRIIGSSWRSNDEVKTYANYGWPFAFRGPSGMLCVQDITELEGVQTYGCSSSNANPDMILMFRDCDGPCSESDRDQFDKDWLTKPPASYRDYDRVTRYAEETAQDGTYTLTMSRFFSEVPGGGTVKYQVGVQVKVSRDLKEVAQKIVNDIATQTV